MTQEILLTLGVTAGALGLFLWGRLGVDVVGLIVLAAVVVLGLVPVEEALAGFANEATITVALMLALSAGLLHTGAVDALGRWISRLAGEGEYRLLVVMLAAVVPVSAFINNTAAVAILIPVMLGLARDHGIAPSRLLMPLSFGGMLGGTLTLIGTSTNLLVAGLALDLGVERISLFEITPPALVLAGVGVLYLLTLGRWLTPHRESSRDLLDSYELRDYLSTLSLLPGSRLHGSTLAEAEFLEKYGLHVVQIEREAERVVRPSGRTRLQAGDTLVVHGKTPEIAEAVAGEHFSVAGIPSELRLEDEEVRLAEMLIPVGSVAIGRTVGELRLRARHGISVLAVQRHGASLRRPVPEVRLAPGDMLLALGPEEDLQTMHERGMVALLGAVESPGRRKRKMRFAVPILLLVVLLAALKVTTILVAALLGVIAMFLSGSLTPEEAYDEIDWSVIILLGAILSLGIAMQETGTADYLARRLLELTRPWGAQGSLAALYVLTTLLTAIISNNAAAVVLTPIAVEAARGLGVSPMPLIVAVMFAASNSFITPIGYQTNTFIYGPGGYRFSDFLRVGGPLNLLLALLAPFVIPWFFPF